ncbi:hypothetical protein K488DRAFT_84277 [Vararia minispora EC-137]|uniref:Uncharacterized protein n=1 Tax=Vararia minispora EC-137 TaxID=1314806 RepID=A0ACB8QRF0_9AGAM|nr:hypothetical protein K488DRAFT_84277 [Vararia minispora EC-137]
MSKIASRTENYEFRRYLLPEEVKRMWIYVSSPQQALRYIATISRGKRPGEIDEEGTSNADFNAGRKNDMPFAYKILELYELKEPLPLSEMKETYGTTYPQRYMYTPQKMLDSIVVAEQTRLF